ncbi:MAG: hypothetical protein G01um101444_257 [Parcubacteria group bacterium Gr01-1014_44]|nr:MAG: hypothetical protein G01um101444_257 [Parcubacteria group bacterium Gr01-1014_44]
MDWKSKRYLIPKTGLLDEFKTFTDMVEGTYLQDIPENALIEVQAEDIILNIAIIDKDRAEIAVKGNVNFFTTPETCLLAGSTLGGSFLKMRWLGVGFRIELHRLKKPLLDPAHVITTSFIQKINILEDPDAILNYQDKALALIEEALKNSRTN